MDRNTNAVGVVHNGTAVSVTESFTQIEIEIVNKIGIVHNNLNFDVIAADQMYHSYHFEMYRL